MSLKKLVNDKELWDAFSEELDRLIAGQHKSMESVEDPKDMYRSQGSIHALRRLKHMRDQVNGQR